VLYATVIEKIDTTRGQIYNVGGGPPNQRNLIEGIDQIGELTNTKPVYSFSDWREGDQVYYVSDIAKAKEELGWEPRIQFDRGLHELVAWARELLIHRREDRLSAHASSSCHRAPRARRRPTPLTPRA